MEVVYDIGIYEIYNMITNKRYIGSSFEVKNRINNHKSMLRRNNHHSLKLQRAWNKYGESNFIFRKLESCTLEELLILEQKYIDSYKFKELYNIKPKAGSNIGFKHSSKTIDDIIKKRAKPVLAMDNQSNILKRFISVGKAAKFYNIDKSGIMKNIKLNKCNKKGISFCYECDYEVLDRTYIKPKVKVEIDKRGNKIKVADVYGNFIKEYVSMASASRELGIISPNIRRKLNKVNKFIRLKDNQVINYVYYTDDSIIDVLKSRHLKVENLIKDENGDIDVYDIYDRFLFKTTRDKLKKFIKVPPSNLKNRNNYKGYKFKI